jgi:deoxyribonuclease V
MRSPLVPVPRRDAQGRWDLGEALACQRRLRDRVERRDRVGKVRRVAGADVSYEKRGSTLYAAVVVLDAATLEVLETGTAVGPARFPYLPGFLSFRESPAILDAFSRLRGRPDLLLVDGHGVAHPRGLGIASHLGVILNLPSIGVAKSILVGEAEEPERDRGSVAPLRHRRERIASVVRTRTGVAPVYVSTGHRVSLQTAVRWVLRCGNGYRLPEPTRRAHLAVNALRVDGKRS